MALDDFDSIPSALRPSAPDDEDLFNFPAADARETPAPPAPIATPPPPTVAAPLPARPPVVSQTPPPVAPPPAPVPAPAAITPPAPRPPVEKVSPDAQRAPLPSTKQPVRKPALTSVEAELELEPAPPPPQVPETPVPKRSVRSRANWLAIGGVLALNVVGFTVLWVSNRSYRSGIEGLRDDLVVTMHDLRRTASESNSSVQAAPSAEHPQQPIAPAHSPAVPLAPYEETSLLLARQEIDEGEHAQARKRLYRLLAVADRIDAELRKDIEARAMYLVADSYRRQADARREAKP